MKKMLTEKQFINLINELNKSLPAQGPRIIKQQKVFKNKKKEYDKKYCRLKDKNNQY